MMAGEASQRNIKLTLAYDGTRYHGWQRQDNALTLQEVIEDCIFTMTGKPVRLTASGRTDAGVHALNQVCNFKTDSSIPPEEFRKGLNSLLPDDIYVKELRVVPGEFHARYGVKRKTYEYRILNREEPDIFSRNYLWHIRFPLDVEEMAGCLCHVEGIHDFSAFRASGSGNSNPTRTVFRAELIRKNHERVCLYFEATGFLRHMARNIVGTVVEVGLGKRRGDDLKAILESKDRGRAGMKAPPQGLFLVEVFY